MIDIKLLEYLESYLTDSRKTRFYEVISQRTRHFTVAIEDVYHLHNTSAVLRSCDIFGIQDMHIIEAVNANRLDREIALGAQKWVDVYKHKSAIQCMESLRAKEYQIVATSPHQDDVFLENFDVSKKSCFFFGRETEGLTQTILDQADVCLKIPMVGFTESLNVSVSAAIILQHVTSQLKQTSINWRLSEEEQQEKRLDWCKKTIKSFDQIVDHFYSNR